eukprot:5465856-Lingulodinium_polyedra.AAC.1
MAVPGHGPKPVEDQVADQGGRLLGQVVLGGQEGWVGTQVGFAGHGAGVSVEAHENQAVVVGQDCQS